MIDVGAATEPYSRPNGKADNPSEAACALLWPQALVVSLGSIPSYDAVVEVLPWFIRSDDDTDVGHMFDGSDTVSAVS